VVKFDLSRISGQAEWYSAVKAGAPDLTEEEWQITDIFDRLPQDVQDRITAQYRKTGAPVSVRIKREVRP